MHDGNYKMLIADDEMLARSRLATMIGDIGGWDIVAETGNGRETLDACMENPPDVVLLDIRMPGMDGIEVARHLAELESPPAIIFTTAYDDYAVKAFETHAVGYLLKPIRRERLLRELAHAAKLERMKLAQLAEASKAQARGRIPVTMAGRLSLIPVADVIAFRADQKYVEMVYEKAGEIRTSLIDEPLKSLEEEFAVDFVRIHRNSLVRMDRIEGLETVDNGHAAVMHGYAEKLPVSRRHYTALKQQLQS